MDRIEREKRTVEAMIRIYCRHKEHNDVLCDDCTRLLEYARKKLGACRYGNDKTACRICSTHCYAPAYREKIREVMKYSGPRLIFFRPFMALIHLFGK